MRLIIFGFSLTPEKKHCRVILKTDTRRETPLGAPLPQKRQFPIPRDTLTGMQNTQIVAGIFYAGSSFSKALSEFEWTLRQNAAFWQNAVLYCDPEAWTRIRSHAHKFREVVVDDSMPPIVSAQRRWCCKGWWAHKALERFPRILYCDFDIFVLRLPDTALERFLDRGPKFLYMPDYRTPAKQVGCGVAFYDRETPSFERFLDLLYHKWNCDERAWTEALGMTGEKLLASDGHLNPHVVDYTRLIDPAEPLPEPYLIHGISGIDDGLHRMRRIGFGARHFSLNISERLSHLRHAFFRRLHGTR